MNDEERSTVIFLISEYTRCHSILEKAEIQISEIGARRNPNDSDRLKSVSIEAKTQIEMIDFYRKFEKDFWKEIKKKYGPGDFDPDAFEYIPKNKTNKNVTKNRP